jgi:hypothetical protein
MIVSKPGRYVDHIYGQWHFMLCVVFLWFQSTLRANILQKNWF